METTIATGKDSEGLRWAVKRWDEDGFTQHYLELGAGKAIVLNDEIIAALEALPELD
ncbi:MAG: hypothetical protein JWO11_3606 [Nocardioides sp.]|nr:hypothetical protein [Nocardioides sp.]